MMLFSIFFIDRFISIWLGIQSHSHAELIEYKKKIEISSEQNTALTNTAY